MPTDRLRHQGRSPSRRDRPRVLLVGSDDVDARIDLMRRLRDEFDVAAAGTAPALAARFEENGFAYHHFPLHRGSSPLRDLRTLGALCLLLGRLRPDVVHTFDTKICVYGRLAARAAGVPVVLGTIPGLGSLYSDNGSSSLRRLVRSIYEQLQALASRYSDLTIFQNQDDAREFIAKGVVPEAKAHVIAGSGVRTKVYDPARVPMSERRRVRGELGVPDDAVLVTMVSRIIRSKGVQEFVHAAQETRRHEPSACFLLVGPADQGSVDCYSTEELAALKQSVRWPGPRRDIATILAASDVFVLPSAYREGIPRVLLEAASMGLPLVTTRSPGCADAVVEGVNGLLVPVRDAAALTRAEPR